MFVSPIYKQVVINMRNLVHIKGTNLQKNKPNGAQTFIIIIFYDIINTFKTKKVPTGVSSYSLGNKYDTLTYFGVSLMILVIVKCVK